jgi:tetratricopeptide (TPR) repeat protein
VLAFLARQTTPLATLPWWQLRSHLVHLALLDEPVGLDDTILSSVAALIAQAPDADTAASISLELGLLHHRLGSDRAANQAFLAASRTSGLEFELTGAMGKKTKWQVNELSQLVLLAESRKRDGEDENAKPLVVPDTLALNDDTLLEETEFTKVTQTGEGRLAHIDPSAQPALHPLDQALLLSLCLAQGNSSPAHGLTAQQMMPFVTRVVSHPRNWSVHTVALLLRSRLESNRSRTVERATLQLAALVEQMPTTDASVATAAERLQFFHQLPLPSKWEMERELAKRYLSLGVIRSALDIFTRLEMWEDAVACLQRMEREAEAERIVRDLLEGRKIESDVVVTLGRATLSDLRRQKLTSARAAKLWCLLGDIALNADDAPKNPAAANAAAIDNYNKAWEISGKSSSRAQRSLAALYVSMKDFDRAIPAFRAALAINPLFAHSWFVLGVCFMRLERWSEARDAFKRGVAVNEDDAEGWNNLAAVYLRINEEGLEDGEVRYKLE